jgi:hypothetical protein
MAKNEIDEVVEDLLSIVTDALASVCVMVDRYNIDNDSILKYLVDTLTAVQNYETNYTNADRIRSMSVEELAEWITNICDIERHEKLALSLTSIGVSTATFVQSIGGSTYSLFAHFILLPPQDITSETLNKQSLHSDLPRAIGSNVTLSTAIVSLLQAISKIFSANFSLFVIVFVLLSHNPAYV